MRSVKQRVQVHGGRRNCRGPRRKHCPQLGEQTGRWQKASSRDARVPVPRACARVSHFRDAGISGPRGRPGWTLGPETLSHSGSWSGPAGALGPEKLSHGAKRSWCRGGLEAGGPLTVSPRLGPRAADMLLIPAGSAPQERGRTAPPVRTAAPLSGCPGPCQPGLTVRSRWVEAGRRLWAPTRQVLAGSR